ncbi:hypothetical protein PV326_003779 [Microctonus aethiopoides]|nr:hypothetical protein PV326_003779 [Microctonus aethiopoides]
MENNDVMCEWEIRDYYCYYVENMWKEIFSCKNQSYALLSGSKKKLVDSNLIHPYSNAEAEHLFSNVREMVTKERNQISTKTVAATCKVRPNFQAHDETTESFRAYSMHKENVEAQVILARQSGAAKQWSLTPLGFSTDVRGEGYCLGEGTSDPISVQHSRPRVIKQKYERPNHRAASEENLENPRRPSRQKIKGKHSGPENRESFCSQTLKRQQLFLCALARLL